MVRACRYRVDALRRIYYMMIALLTLYLMNEYDEKCRFALVLRKEYGFIWRLMM